METPMNSPEKIYDCPDAPLKSSPKDKSPVGKRRLDFDDLSSAASSTTKHRKPGPQRACAEPVQDLELGPPALLSSDKQASIRRWLDGAQRCKVNQAEAEGRARSLVLELKRLKPNLDYKINSAKKAIQESVAKLQGEQDASKLSAKHIEADSLAAAAAALNCFGHFMQLGMGASSALEVARVHEEAARKEREAAAEEAMRHLGCCEAVHKIKSKLEQSVERWLEDPIQVCLDLIEEYRELIPADDAEGKAMLDRAEACTRKLQNVLDKSELSKLLPAQIRKLAADARDELLAVHNRPFGQPRSTLALDAQEIYEEIEEYLQLRGEVEIISARLEEI